MSLGRLTPRSTPSETATGRRTSPGVIAAALALAAACLGTPEEGKGCACRPQAATPAALNEAPPPAVQSIPPTPEGERATESAAASVLPDFAESSWTRVPSRAGKYLVCWRTPSGEVPRNEDFELEVWVLRDGAPVSGASLSVSAWMPDHGHGMLRQPRTELRDDGAFRVAGMLLHMRGHWQLRFDVLEGALSETAECALDL